MKIDTKQMEIEIAGVVVSRIASNPQIWEDAKMFAHDMMGKDLSGQAKHDKIKADLTMLFKVELLPFAEEIAGALLDSLIKLAFIYVTSQAQSK